MVELDLHLKLEKCTFATSTVEYLGMIVKPDQLAMDLVKLNGIAQWPIPSKVKDICSFLGFANFYHQFIPNYSTITHPLIDLTKKNLPWNWTPSQQQAFQSLLAPQPSGFQPHHDLHSRIPPHGTRCPLSLP